jgi:Vacuolar protein sorting-associated protein 26
MEVGVDERLHIVFNLAKNAYHTKEWVEGTVTFLKVKFLIKKM